MGILAAFAVPHPPLLIPGVGDQSKLQVQKTEQAYHEVAARSAALEPETLVIFSPHATLYCDYFHISPGRGAKGSFNSFGSETSFAVEYDEEFVAHLESLLAQRGIPGGTLGEREPALDHGTMVPLQFFVGAASDGSGIGAGAGVKIVRIGLSGLDREVHRAFGEAVACTAEELDRKTVIIASGDLSHKLLESGPYGFVPEGPEFDEQMSAALAVGSVTSMIAIDEALSEAAAECGLRSFIMMGGALENQAFEPELLSYEGPLGVGYAVASYVIPGLDLADRPRSVDSKEASSSAAKRSGQGVSPPVILARQTLQSYFAQGKIRPTLDTPEIQELLEQLMQNVEAQALCEELLHTQAGAFVSLHKNGQLRGCIGTIAPVRDSTLSEIIHNAVSAAVEDPRFLPLAADELERLEIKVDVLGKPEPVSDHAALDANRYGVIVSLGHRRGLLLPALDGVNTPEEQIAIALSKAGIGPEEPYEIERFEVVRYA